MRRSILLLVAMLIPVFAFSAQEPESKTSVASEFASGFVQGMVKGMNDKAIAGAPVEIRNVETKQRLADTLTDVDGKFAFLALPLAPGNYVVRASQSHFAPDQKGFSVARADEVVKQEFTLVLYYQRSAASRPKSGGKGRIMSTPQVGNYNSVRVFYATDRKGEVDGSRVKYVATKGAVSYGICEVSIPWGHTPAEMERPSVWRLEFRDDPQKHIVLQSVLPEAQQEFFKDVASSVAESKDKDAFVFVHGYNVSFEDAALRTAQLAYDFGFQGAPIFYSWPSRGSLLGYADDERMVQESVADLKQFLADVATRSGARTVHLIAHSMGNRALLPALAQLEKDPNFKSASEFHQIILAAPDVDRDTFIKLASEIRHPTQHMTLYVSSHDQALQAAQFLFHKPPRAGEAGPKAVVLPGMDTIDVSGVSFDALGHSYYGDNNTVVKDLMRVLKSQAPPRPGLSKVVVGTLAYWLLQLQN